MVDTTQAELLIGADGIHSRVREIMLGKIRCNTAGYTAWRGVAPAPAKEFKAGETWGKGQRFGFVPLNRDRVYWFATANRPENENAHPAERQAELLDKFGGWHYPIRELLETTPTGTILRNDIYDLPPLEAWTVGRVTLLGDAAHAMTPNLGQGACQAIEDGVVLAGCLAKFEDILQASGPIRKVTQTQDRGHRQEIASGWDRRPVEQPGAGLGAKVYCSPAVAENASSPAKPNPGLQY